MVKNNTALSQQAKSRRMREFGFQSFVTAIAVIFVLLAFIPIFLMLFLSLKR